MLCISNSAAAVRTTRYVFIHRLPGAPRTATDPLDRTFTAAPSFPRREQAVPSFLGAPAPEAANPLNRW